jgi:hypothetical protein
MRLQRSQLKCWISNEVDNMTECKDAMTALMDISQGKDIRLSSSDFQKLISLGLIDHVKGSDMDTKTDEDLDFLKTKLENIKTMKKSFQEVINTKESRSSNKTPIWLYKKDKEYRDARDELINLEKKERTLRTQFLNQMQSHAQKGQFARVNDENMHITYKGRELLGMLQQRINRVEGTELGTFISGLDDIKKHFKECSEKARLILKKISPLFPGTDEIHFRSAAVGLSGQRETPDEIESHFVSSYKKISDALTWDGPMAINLAESLTVMANDKSDLDSLTGKAVKMAKAKWSPGFDKRDQVRAVSIILSSRKDTDDLIDRTREIAQRYCPGSPGSAAFLATQSRTRTRDREDLFRRFELFRNQINPNSSALPEHHMAAALMTATDDPEDVVLQRYLRANTMLNQFNGTSMEVPAAMISLLPMDVSESMDNLRLAAATIGANRLSLGGMENLSLGMKLLMISATSQVEVGEKAPSPIPTVKAKRTMGLSVLGITGITLASALILGAGLVAFHELSLHNLAVRDYTFHPVHMHYIYG